MNKNSEFATLVSNLLKARFPCLYITSWEEDRLLSLINSIAKDENLIKTPRDVFTWKLTTGMIGNNGQKTCATGGCASKDPVKALEFVEEYDKPGLFVFLDFHIYFGCSTCGIDPLIIRKVRDVAKVLKQSPQPKNIIFISPTRKLPEELQKDISIVDFDLPSLEDIKNLLDDMIEVNQQNSKLTIDLKEDEKERLAKAALGLTVQEAENAFARAMVDDGHLNINDVKIILDEKS